MLGRYEYVDLYVIYVLNVLPVVVFAIYSDFEWHMYAVQWICM